MKLARPLSMFSLVTFCLVSCMAVNPHKTVYNHVDLNIDHIPSIQKGLIDSAKKDTLPQKAKEEDKKEFDKLKSKNIVQPELNKDSILSLNYQWQKAYLRVVNRNIKSNDSLKYLIIEQGKKADAYYTKAAQANFYAQQTKHAEASSNYVFYTGFATLLILMAYNTRLNYKIKQQTA